jgi:hypothetical protein
MNNEQFEERCINYLYNEMSEQERREFQNLLATDRESNLKFNAIKKARTVLGSLPLVGPREDPYKPADARKDITGSRPAAAGDAGSTTLPGSGKKQGTATSGNTGRDVKSQQPTLRILPGGPFGRVISSAAAILLGILIVGAISGMQVRWDDNGFAMSMSMFSNQTLDETPPPVYLLEDETLGQLRTQQEQLFSEILAAEREQQRIMLLETLSEYADAIETRRMIDMQLIGMELADFQQQTNQQLSQTDRVIYQLIETLSYHQEQQDE